MKKWKVLVGFLMVSVFVLTGCADENEATASFYLDEISGITSDDDETPYMYMVNPSYDENQVIVFRERVTMDRNAARAEEMYELDSATITDDEIVIEYNGKKETFKRLSESVAENEDKVQYQLISVSEPIE